MTEELQPETWPKLFRHYLALGREEDLAAAVACAPPEVREFLAICGRGDAEGANQWIGSLRESFPERGEARFTLELGYCGVFARSCEALKCFPLEQQAMALETGMNACHEAIRFAGALEDLPCTARYSSMVASGFRASSQTEAAYGAYRATECIYKRLAEERPDAYLPYVAETLNSLGNLLSELRRPEAARTAYEEALTIRRRLAAGQPEVYLADLATTLNNFGALLSDVRELEAARAVYEEVLAILQDQTDDRPEEYLRVLTATLNNLGALLRDLREMEAARAA